MTDDSLKRGWVIKDMIESLKEGIRKNSEEKFSISRIVASYRGGTPYPELEEDIKRFQDEIDFTKKRLSAFMEMKIAELQKEFDSL
jgi:hypothetical protein